MAPPDLCTRCLTRHAVNRDCHPRDIKRVDLGELARMAFNKHQIAKESAGRWLLRKPSETAFFWTEIICLAGNGLLVDGDIEPVIFRYGPADFEARVHWMGSRKTAHDHYFVEKAAIGTRGGSRQPMLFYWDPAIARRDLDDLQAEIVEEHGPREAMDIGSRRGRRRAHAAVYDAIEDAKLGLDDALEDQVLAEVMAPGYYDETPRIGTMEAPRLFYAHAALQRLSLLLDARRGPTPQPTGKP